VEYNNPYAIQMTSNIIQTFDQEFIDRLESNDLYDYNDSDAYKNIIIKYMNGLTPVTDADVLALEHVDYIASQDMYYTLPIVVFCVERYIKSLIST
jgi:hypothetical protein